MAFSALVNSWTAWFLTNRNGTKGSAASPGTALVSDLAANDYVVGARALVVSTGATAGGNRTLTVTKPGLGYNYDVVWPAASAVVILR